MRQFYESVTKIAVPSTNANQTYDNIANTLLAYMGRNIAANESAYLFGFTPGEDNDLTPQDKAYMSPDGTMLFSEWAANVLAPSLGEKYLRSNGKPRWKRLKKYIGNNQINYSYSDISNSLNYTVPAGKMMYVLHYSNGQDWNTPNFLTINGQQYSRDDDIPRVFYEGTNLTYTADVAGEYLNIQYILIDNSLFFIPSLVLCESILINKLSRSNSIFFSKNFNPSITAFSLPCFL